MGTAVGCGSDAKQPIIHSLEPASVCSDVASTIVLMGEDFSRNATVTATPVGGGSAISADVVVATSPMLTATFSSGLAVGSYEIMVDNGSDLTATAATTLTVEPPPLVFFVDPPVVYSAIPTEVTIFTTGLAESADSVVLVDSTDEVTELTFASPDRPNRILATIPSGLAPGSYLVRVTSALGCVGDLEAGIEVTDQLNLEITSVDPSFVSPTLDTAVTVQASTSGGEPGLESGLRLYLNPSAGSSASATALRAVLVESATLATAVIPGGLTSGDYDLIAVNPDGNVGVLTMAVTVTVGEPPVISSILPASLDNNADQAAVLRGEHFATDDGGIEVTMTCRHPDTGVLSMAAGSVSGAVTSTRAEVTLPTGDVAAGSVCLVTLTNVTDGSSFAYSAVSVKNPAQNLAPWAATSSMVEARRSHALVAGRPTNASRFLYAAGGYDADAALWNNVESVAVDAYGDLGDWSLQRNSLPTPRADAGYAKVGRFLYLTGGDDGDAVVDTTLRAEILDPLQTPEVADLDARLCTTVRDDCGGSGAGLEDGSWFYRLAAVFPSSDGRNPGGESLPGEVLTVTLPERPELFVLTLAWDAIPGASGYRVYRTPTADAPLSELQLLAQTDCAGVCDCSANPDQCRFVDADTDTPDAAQTPLPQGSLGVWHAVSGGALTTPRAGHATVAFANPNASGQWFIYAFGGYDDTNVLLNTYEYATLSLQADGSHTMSGWASVEGLETIGTARSHLLAWSVDPDSSSAVPEGTVYVFVGLGDTGAATRSSVVMSGVINADSTGPRLTIAGATTLDVENGPGAGLSAGCAVEGGGFIYALGGETNAGLTAADTSSAVQSGPALSASWAAPGGGSLTTRRAFCAAAKESAFFFVSGGRTAALQASRSVETTVQ